MLLFSVLVPVAFAYGQDEDHTVMLQRKIKTNITKEVENYAEVDEKSQGDVQDNMEMVIFWESRFCKSPTGAFGEVKDAYGGTPQGNGWGQERVKRVLEQVDACMEQGSEDIVSLADCKKATMSGFVMQFEGNKEFPTGCIKFSYGKGFAFNAASGPTMVNDDSAQFEMTVRTMAPPCQCPSQVDYCIWKEDIAPGCEQDCWMRACEYYTPAPAGTSCPEKTQIHDVAECKAAAEGLGKPYKWSVDNPKFPAGCFLYRKGHVLMNVGGLVEPSGPLWRGAGGICIWKSRSNPETH